MEFVAETNMETGKTPSGVLKSEPLVRRAVKIYNRMERGLVTINDLSYKDLQLGEMFGGVVNQKQSERLQEQRRKTRGSGGGL